MRTLTTLLLSTALALGCSEEPKPEPQPECTPSCEGRHCGSDGCSGSCGSCGEGKACTDGGQCVATCNPEPDSAICQRLQIPCGPALATDNCGQQRTVQECGPCGAGFICDTAIPACVVEPPPNDRCEGAIELSFGANGVATVSGDTTYASSQGRSAYCNTGDGMDVVYRLAVPVKSDIQAVVNYTDPDLSPVLYLRSVCDGTERAQEFGCAEDSRGSPVTMLAESVPAGTYYLWVDSYYGEKGAFTLEIAMTPSDPPPANDTCAAAQVLTFDGSGVATVTGTNVNASHDMTSACAAGAMDVVYKFTLAEPKAVTVEMSAIDSGVRPVVYVSRTCQALTSQIPGGCADDSVAQGTASVQLPRLDPGTYYVWADSDYAVEGAFRLQVSTAPVAGVPANDLCAGALDLTFDGTGAATVTGDTSAAGDEQRISCQSPDGPDVLYRFTLGAEASLTATVESTSGKNDFVPAIAIRSGCDAGGFEVEESCGHVSATCWPGTAECYTSVAKANRLAAGEYFVVIDGELGTRGPFRLTLQREAPVAGPANESCGSAEALSFSNGVASAQGTTVGAQFDAAVSCVWVKQDVVYGFSLAAPQKISATATPVGTTYAPALLLRRGCGAATSADELACLEAPGAGQPVSVTVPTAPAGEYFLWVNGTSRGGAGAFALQVTLSAPAAVPQNDTCAGALPLGPSPVQGDTSLAVNDTGAWPFSYACDVAAVRDLPGRDLVYSFMPTATRDYTITLTPAQDVDAAVWVTTECGEPLSCLKLSDLPNEGRVETLTFRGFAGTTYYVHVDSMDYSFAGQFTLAVQ